MGQDVQVEDAEGRWSIRLGSETLAYSETADLAGQIAAAYAVALKAASNQEDLATRHHPPRSCILIVDDDPIQRLICREILEQEGFRVREASDGDQVSPILDEQFVDVVVLDMLMPNKDGLEVIGFLQRRHPFTKILAISSGGRIGSNELLHWASVLGANAVLPKPFGGNDFASAVRALLDPGNR